MNPTISVVIPVYNVENYLKRCVESVLSQNFTDYEVILIDDGSVDKSCEICDEYAERYDSIRVLHKKNAGLSHTRNEGIKMANGKYIYFLDSDDYIIDDCLQILYQNAIQNNADVSCGSFGYFDDKDIVKNELSCNNAYVCNGKEACMLLLYGKRFNTSSCNILLKKDIAEANLFPVGKYHEDEMTTFRYFLNTQKIVITDSKTYLYYQREGSITHRFEKQVIVDELLSADYYVEFCKAYGKKLTKASLFKKYCLYQHVLDNYPQLKESEMDMYNDILGYLKKNVFGVLMDSNVSLRFRFRALKNAI